MITRENFMMGRDAQYPTSEALEVNAARLLYRVNRLLAKFNVMYRASISSGYRPGKYNDGYAPSSAHLTCEAVDVADQAQTLARWILKDPKVLTEFDLYIEDPAHTKTWVHFSTRAPKSGNRIFIP